MTEHAEESEKAESDPQRSEEGAEPPVRAPTATEGQEFEGTRPTIRDPAERGRRREWNLAEPWGQCHGQAERMSAASSSRTTAEPPSRGGNSVEHCFFDNLKGFETMRVLENVAF